MPFKCNRDNFEKTYQNEYKGKISYRFIRESLNRFFGSILNETNV